MKNALVSVLLVSLFVCSVAAFAEEPATTAEPAAAAATPAVSTVDPKAYPLDVCIVSGEKLGEMGEPVIKEYDGREVKFCCKMCVKTFEKEQAKWLKKLDDEIILAHEKKYPLTTCVVSDEKLGGMGEPVNYMYKNQLVRFCCKGCIPTFAKEPDKYLAKLTFVVPATAEQPDEKKE